MLRRAEFRLTVCNCLTGFRWLTFLLHTRSESICWKDCKALNAEPNPTLVAQPVQLTIGEIYPILITLVCEAVARIGSEHSIMACHSNRIQSGLVSVHKLNPSMPYRRSGKQSFRHSNKHLLLHRQRVHHLLRVLDYKGKLCKDSQNTILKHDLGLSKIALISTSVSQAYNSKIIPAEGR